MTRTKRTLSVAIIFCLLPYMPIHAHESDEHSEARAQASRLQLVGAEIEVKMHELELKMAERAVEEATLEVDTLKLHLEAAQQTDDSRGQAHVKLQLKQAEIRVEMRKIQTDMARLKIEAAKVGLLQHARATQSEKTRKPAPVRLEYVDDLEVVIIRGTKGNVERIRALIESANQPKKQKEKN